LFFSFGERERENEKNYPINFCPFVDEIKRHTQKIKIKKGSRANELTIDCRLSLLICIAKHPTKAGAQHTHKKKKSQTGARSFG
jgi:hypothetical protein